MVIFPSLGNELQMRSFLESLDSEHASSATSVKVKVPTTLIECYFKSDEQRKENRDWTKVPDAHLATLTLTWSKNTRKVQVQGPLAMLSTLFTQKLMQNTLKIVIGETRKETYKTEKRDPC